MDIFSILLTIAGLCAFETICSIDNAIINAEVLSTMREKYRKIFITWGIFFGVFVVRLLLPWVIVWAAMPQLSFLDALFATFSDNPQVLEAVEASTPILLMGGGTFLVFLFFDWLFLEPKNYGLKGEEFIHKQGVWFFAVVSVLLAVIVWLAIGVNAIMAFSAVLGSTAFFIVHGFRQNAEIKEKQMLGSNLSDISKIFYLEIIDATFSIDGVLGAFAFTLSIPLILIGNGLGAIIVREITVRNISKIKKYRYLKNGAMYSVFFLGTIMVLDSFGVEIPSWVSPIITFLIIGFFFIKSKRAITNNDS